MKFLKALIFILFSFGIFPKQSFAAKGEYSTFLFFGEAYGVSNFRVGLKTFDVGVDLQTLGLYFGPRMWLKQAYTGMGPWIGTNDVGVYGMLGYEVSLFGLPLLSLSGEFYGIGTALGKTHAIANLGVGLKW